MVLTHCHENLLSVSVCVILYVHTETGTFPEGFN